MKYQCTLIAVEEMERSKKFYCELLGCHVVADFGANVTLDCGIALQTRETWERFINTQKVVLPNNSGELYFETTEMDLFLKRLKEWHVQLVHCLKEHSWGQRVIRFYDPDGHIIEVGEAMDQVVKRFQNQGMTVEEVAVRMDVPLDYVKTVIAERKTQ